MQQLVEITDTKFFDDLDEFLENKTFEGKISKRISNHLVLIPPALYLYDIRAVVFLKYPARGSFITRLFHKKAKFFHILPIEFPEQLYNLLLEFESLY